MDVQEVFGTFYAPVTPTRTLKSVSLLYKRLKLQMYSVRAELVAHDKSFSIDRSFGGRRREA